MKYRVGYGEEEKYGDEKNKLLEERARLTGEITSGLRDIGHLETELDRLIHDIAETGLYTMYSCFFFLLVCLFNKRIRRNKYQFKVLAGETSSKQLFAKSCFELISRARFCFVFCYLYQIFYYKAKECFGTMLLLQMKGF